MKNYLFVIGFAVAAGALAGPSVALGAKLPGHEGGFVALNELNPDGTVVSVPIRRGESAPVTVGVAFNNNVSPRGAVLKVQVSGDVDLPRSFDNCWYFVTDDSQGAWCQFERTLQMSTPYALSPFTICAGRRARADRMDPVIVQWFDHDYGAEQGGIKGLAEQDAGPGSKPVKGSSGPLTLQETDKLVVKNNPPAGSVPVHLVTPPAQSPTTPPATTPAGSSTAVATPADAATTQLPAETEPPAGSTGGGLPITGSKAAMYAGIGVLLVLAGAIGLLAARRRTRFTA
jgi:hypothetical protein